VGGPSEAFLTFAFRNFGSLSTCPVGNDKCHIHKAELSILILQISLQYSYNRDALDEWHTPNEIHALTLLKTKYLEEPYLES